MQLKVAYTFTEPGSHYRSSIMPDQVLLFGSSPEGGFYEPRIVAKLFEDLLEWCAANRALPEAGAAARIKVLELTRERICWSIDAIQADPWPTLQIIEFYLMFGRAFLLALRLPDDALPKALLPDLGRQAGLAAALPGAGLDGLAQEFNLIFQGRECRWVLEALAKKLCRRRKMRTMATELSKRAFVCLHAAVPVYAHLIADEVEEFPKVRNDLRKALADWLTALAREDTPEPEAANRDVFVEEGLFNLALMLKSARRSQWTPQAQWLSADRN